jgi:hypothetical protein
VDGKGRGGVPGGSCSDRRVHAGVSLEDGIQEPEGRRWGRQKTET